MYRRRNRLTGRTRKLIIGVAALTIVGGAFAVSTGISSAGENCTGLDQALQNNLNFIAGQKANPDAQSAARIANRQAVVDLIRIKALSDAGVPLARIEELLGADPAEFAAAITDIDAALKQRIRELTGLELNDPDIHFNLQLATRAWGTLQALGSDR